MEEREKKNEQGLRRNLFRVFGRTFYILLGADDWEERFLKEKNVVCQSRPELLEFGNVMKGERVLFQGDWFLKRICGFSGLG